MTRQEEVNTLIVPFIDRWMGRNRGLVLHQSVITRMTSVLNCAYQRIDYNKLFLECIYPIDVQYANSLRVTWLSSVTLGGNNFVVCQLPIVINDAQRMHITTKTQGKIVGLVTGETLAEAFKKEFLA
jgi:hypothetical protein